MANYNVVRTDRMMGTQVDAYLRSFKYQPSGKDTAIENGMFVKLGSLIDGEREFIAADTPSKNTPISEIVLVASPEWMPDERMKYLTDYINEAGVICRGYLLHSKDCFSITVGCFSNEDTDAPVVGDVVELTDDIKVSAVTTATSGSTVIGKIIAIEKAGTLTYYVIEVA